MRHLFVDTVDVRRRPTAPVNGKVTERSPQTVYTAMRCRVEVLTTRERERETLLGRSTNAQLRISWLTGTLLEGDDVVWRDDTYTLGEVVWDNSIRSCPYYIAVLSKKA